MTTLNGIPVYKIKINSDPSHKTGMDFLSLVDYPAIEKTWVALAPNKSPLKFTVDEDRQMLYGPILIPDFPIYRFDKDTKQEYYVVFTKEEIEKIVRKSQQKTIKLNYQHKENSNVDATVQEIWLTGKKDKSQDYGFELPEGSSFVGTHIADKAFWTKEIKSGNVKGFSIEGFLDMELKRNNMEKFVTAKTDKGIEIKSPSEKFVVGAMVTTTDADGKDVPISDGSYTLENGVVVKVAAGKITEISEEPLNDEELKAFEKIFSDVITKSIQPLTDKITLMETKLSTMAAVKSATENDDVDPPMPREKNTHDVLLTFRKLLNKN